MWGSSSSKSRTLHDHTDALAEFQRIKPWRGEPNSPRPLGRRRDRNYSIYVTREGAVACRLYSTDIVTYWPGNGIELTPHSTRTTSEFANDLLPPGIDAHFTHQLGCVIELNGRDCYKIDRTVMLVRKDYGWEISPDTPTCKFERYRLDNEKATAAKRLYPYADLCAFVPVYLGLTGGDRRKAFWTSHWAHNKESLLALLTERKFEEIIKVLGPNAPDTVRRAIYHQHGCIVTDEFERLSYGALRKVHDSRHWLRGWY